MQERMNVQEAVGFSIVSETQIFKRFRTINERIVQYPDGKQMSFDVLVTTSNKFVTVLPYNTKEKRFSLIREYCQGPHCLGLSVACGNFDARKHTSMQHAAECELSEECMLKGGTWIRLIPDDHPGVMEAKWAGTRFTPFLVLDPLVDETPGDRDAEEYIHEETVGLEELEEQAYAGLMHLPSSVTILMALRHMRKTGLL